MLLLGLLFFLRATWITSEIPKDRRTQWALYVSKIPNAGQGKKTAPGIDHCITQNGKLNILQRKKSYGTSPSVCFWSPKEVLIRGRNEVVYLCSPRSCVSLPLSPRHVFWQKIGKEKEEHGFSYCHGTSQAYFAKWINKQRINRVAW